MKIKILILMILFTSYLKPAVFKVNNEIEFQEAINNSIINSEEINFINFSDSKNILLSNEILIDLVNAKNNKIININGYGTVLDGSSNTDILKIKGNLDFSNSKINLSNFSIKNSNGTYGGAIYIKNIDVKIENIEFDSNIADYGSAIFISKSSSDIFHIDIIDSDFTNNISRNNGIIYGQENYTSNIINSYFYNNQVQYNGTVNFSENTKKIIIKDSNFTDNNTISTGSFGAGVIGNNLEINNTFFLRNSSVDGAAITLLDKKTDSEPILILNNSEFHNNFSSNSGGAIFAKDYTKVIVNNSIFNDNKSNNYGGDIRGWEITLNDSNFTNSNSDVGGSIKSNTLKATNIKVSDVFSNTYGGFAYTKDSDIYDSDFTNINTGIKGGLIYTSFDENTSIHKFISNNFNNISAPQCTIVSSIINGDSIVIIKNNKFLENKYKYSFISSKNIFAAENYFYLNFYDDSIEYNLNSNTENMFFIGEETLSLINNTFYNLNIYSKSNNSFLSNNVFINQGYKNNNGFTLDSIESLIAKNNFINQSSVFFQSSNLEAENQIEELEIDYDMNIYNNNQGLNNYTVKDNLGLFLDNNNIFVDKNILLDTLSTKFDNNEKVDLDNYIGIFLDNYDSNNKINLNSNDIDFEENTTSYDKNNIFKELNVSSGWNILSVPDTISVQDMKNSFLSKNKNLLGIFEYTKSGWKFFSDISTYTQKQNIEKEFPYIDYLKKGNGYWFFTEDKEHNETIPENISYSSSSKDNIFEYIEFEKSSWYLIGFPFDLSINELENILLNKNITIKVIYEYDSNLDNNWKYYSPISSIQEKLTNFENIEKIDKMKGYWLLVN